MKRFSLAFLAVFMLTAGSLIAFSSPAVAQDGSTTCHLYIDTGNFTDADGNPASPGSVTECDTGATSDGNDVVTVTVGNNTSPDSPEDQCVQTTIGEVCVGDTISDVAPEGDVTVIHSGNPNGTPGSLDVIVTFTPVENPEPTPEPTVDPGPEPDPEPEVIETPEENLPPVEMTPEPVPAAPEPEPVPAAEEPEPVPEQTEPAPVEPVEPLVPVTPQEPTELAYTGVNSAMLAIIGFSILLVGIMIVGETRRFARIQKIGKRANNGS